MRLTVALVTLAALCCAGCATTVPMATPLQAPAPVPVVQTVTKCLPMKAYTDAQDQAVAAELMPLPATDPVVGFITDYAAMRKADRACQTASGAPPS